MKPTARPRQIIPHSRRVRFMLGEVKQVFQPNHVVAWVLALLTLACLLTGFYLTRPGGPQ